MVDYPPSLDNARGNQDTQHTVEMLPLETPDPTPTRLRDLRHLTFPAPHTIVPVLLLRAEDDVSMED